MAKNKNNKNKSQKNSSNKKDRSHVPAWNNGNSFAYLFKDSWKSNTQKRQYEKSHIAISKVFSQAKDKDLTTFGAGERTTFKDSKGNPKYEYKKGWSKREQGTYKDYKTKAQKFLTLSIELFGEPRLEKITPEMGDEIIKYALEKYSVTYVKGIAQATHAFQSLYNHTRTEKEKINMFDKDSSLDYMSENGLKRLKSENASIIATDEQIATIKEAILKGNSPRKEEVVKALTLAEAVGLRGSDFLRLKPSHIDFETNTAVIDDCKGGKLNTVHLKESLVEEVKKMCEGLHSDTLIIDMRWQSGENKGQRMDSYSALKTIDDVASNAAKRIGIENFSTHSCRKNHGQDFYNKLLEESEAEIDQLVAEAKKNPQATRAYRYEVNRLSRGCKEKKDLDFETRVLWLSSQELNHFRLDITARYIQRRK